MPEPVVFQTPNWSERELIALKDISHSFRGDLTETAAAMRRTRKECDIALFALLGRSATEAAIVLNRGLEVAA